MGLLACPNCNKINQTTRDNCWNCDATVTTSVFRKNPDVWANGTYAYRRNPGGNDYGLRNALQIADSASEIDQKLPEGSGLIDWMEHLLAVVSSDLREIVHNLQYSKRQTNPHVKYMAKSNAKLIKKYADALVDLLNSNIELEDWMKSKLSASASRMDDVRHAIEIEPSYALAAKNPSFDPSLGQNIAKQLFFKNPKGEKRMRSMKRFKRNPNSWSKYLNRRNPQAASWVGKGGDSLFTKPVWGAPLYKRHNPQAASWVGKGGDSLFTKPVWGAPLYKRNNPQAASWVGKGGDSLFTKPVWGAPLYKRHNPQAASWVGKGGDSLFTKPVWGAPLYKRHNPQAASWVGKGGDSLFTKPVWGAPLYKRHNPQAASWVGKGGDSLFTKPVWGAPLYKRHNPQAASWVGQGGNSLFTGPGVWGNTLYKSRKLRRKNPQPPVWGAANISRGSVWGKPLFRNPDDYQDYEDEDLDWDNACRNPDEELDELDEIDDDLGDDDLEEDLDWHCSSGDDLRCNPDEFEEDIEEEMPLYRKKYRRN